MEAVSHQQSDFSTDEIHFASDSWLLIADSSHAERAR